MHGSSDIRRAEADRKRRYRHFVGSGGGTVAVRIADINSTIEFLIETRWLPVSESENKQAIAAALAAMINDLVSRSK